jgi:hypothetical protein
MKEYLIKMLGLANDATDEQIQAAVKDVDVPALKLALANEKKAHDDEKTAAATALANEKAGREADKTASATALANEKAAVKAERSARIELILANAITARKITLAEKPKFAADLEKDLDGTVAALANAKPLTSDSKTRDLGNRKASAVQDRRDRVLALVNERMAKSDEDYVTAFANVKRDNAALFDEMKPVS